MQPLLMLKQTLDVSYDPGALLLDGPHVKFTAADQVLSRAGGEAAVAGFSVQVETGAEKTRLLFARGAKSLDVVRMDSGHGASAFTLTPGMKDNDIKSVLPLHLRLVSEALERVGRTSTWKVVRNRCFLVAEVGVEQSEGGEKFRVKVSGIANVEKAIGEVIHLPGLRGNPERSYPLTAVESCFQGTFDRYTASIIDQWQSQGEEERLQSLGENLKQLGLTWKVATVRRDDTQVELQVGRLPSRCVGGEEDLVNIADVGFGVSQTLPVLVALLIAEPGQLVYLEQPEIHLHPRAQAALARPLLAAAARGVRVVVETHSSLLLLGIQTLVAEGAEADLVKLHWFTRNADTGYTQITSSDLDELGRFEMDWPEDFAEISMMAEGRYLDAVEQRQLAGAD